MSQNFHDKTYAKSVRLRQFVSALTLIALLAILGRTHAQVLYGTLAGTVTDSTGAVIPNANVKALNNGTGTVLSAVTSGDGTYSINNLLPGSYDVTISGNGFSSLERKGVPVTVNSTARIDATLTVGSTAQNITVSAGDLPLLQTDKAEIDYIRSAAVRAVGGGIRRVPEAYKGKFPHPSSDFRDRSGDSGGSMGYHFSAGARRASVGHI